MTRQCQEKASFIVVLEMDGTKAFDVKGSDLAQAPPNLSLVELDISFSCYGATRSNNRRGATTTLSNIHAHDLEPGLILYNGPVLRRHCSHCVLAHNFLLSAMKEATPLSA